MKVRVSSQSISVMNRQLVSNSVGIYECEFEFIGWNGWNKTAVFQLDDETPIEVIIVNNKAVIPFEVLSHFGELRIGVYGTQDEKVMPTVWSKRVEVKLGTTTGSSATPPTPSVYAQILEELFRRADGLEYSENILKLLSGETVIAQVTIQGGSGGISSVEIRVYNNVLQYRIDDGNWMNIINFSTLLYSYATKSWVDSQGFLKQHQSLDEYAKKSWVENKGYITEHQSLDGYATETFVTSKTNPLQSQIDALVSKADVVDVVGTYAELQAYDTTKLFVNDIVKVLDDSTHSNSRSYYRWTTAWTYIGSESIGYTKAEEDELLNEKQNVIADLSNIREGASAGASALQPSALDSYYTKTQTDSAVESHHDSQKLDASHINHETWTFTLDDDTEVNKEVCLWI